MRMRSPFQFISDATGDCTVCFSIFAGEYSVADLRGAPWTRAPPPGAKILSFSCSFRPKNRFTHPLGSWPPPRGKSWICHCSTHSCGSHSSLIAYHQSSAPDKHVRDLRPIHTACLIFDFIKFTSVYVCCYDFIIKRRIVY